MGVKRIEMADWKATRKQKRLVNEVLKSGRLTYGDKTRELERRFAELHGAKHALFTNSGTSALKISLHALKDRHGWKDGDEVIMPAVTFVATMNAILMNNLKPVLVDIDPTTVNIDPKLIEKAITKKTRAIMPVHLLGQPADMDAIMKIAKKHKLEVVEDSCETMFVNKLRGTTACFSSYIAHLMVTGVGGFILTNDDRLATEMRSIMFHGRDESYLNIDDNDKTGEERTEMIEKRFYFPRHGYSDRATELEAALGLGDLDNWQAMIKQRQDNAYYLANGILPVTLRYRKQLGLSEVVSTWSVRSWDTTAHAFMFFPLYVPDRDNLIHHLEYNGVHTRTMMPLTNQPIVKKHIKGNLDKLYPNAAFVNKHGLLLPCHQYLKKRDLDRMVDLIGDFYYA
jgi:dTDP-4-amino-4,6-dideoxygalactose transaminase